MKEGLDYITLGFNHFVCSDPFSHAFFSLPTFLSTQALSGYSYAGSATNIPHQRPQPPSELATHVIPVSVAAGQPLVSPIGFPHHPGPLLHYPPQHGMPGQMAGQPMLSQPAPYPIYQSKVRPTFNARKKHF